MEVLGVVTVACTENGIDELYSNFGWGCLSSPWERLEFAFPYLSFANYLDKRYHCWHITIVLEEVCM